MSTCALCGGRYSWGFKAYKNHCTEFHAFMTKTVVESKAKALPMDSRSIRPVNVSGRTKAEIVAGWEYANYGKLVH